MLGARTGTTTDEEVTMLRILRRRPSPALVIACTALLIALTGTSIAAVEAVPKNSVGSAQLKNNAVTAAKIASNAVTSAKIASNAVTSAKVQNGTLSSADFAAGVLPAPTDAFMRFLNGPIAIPISSTTLTTLSVPQAGNYVISGKAYVAGAVDLTATCRLTAGGDFDESQATAHNSLSLLVGHNFTAGGTADFACSGGLGITANFIKLSAIKVANLTNSG
jgi:hypothetical protein